MEIKLKRLHLINFKGIKDLEVDFKDTTSILGANATGKTTIFDAYSWLLWDKDSLNRKQFGIKPYESSGDTKHGIDCTVEGLLEVDGKKIKLKKIYYENWTNVKGRNTKEFKGNKTKYFINDVPILQKEYNARISEIIEEKQFNLLSNPIYFNAILDKKERREVLLSLIQDVDKEDVIKANEELKELDLDNYSIDEIKAMAKASASKINKEIESLPARIDELEKSKNTYDFKGIEEEKKATEKRLEEIDKILSSEDESTKLIKEKRILIQDKEADKRVLESEATKEYYNIKKKLEDEFELKRMKHREEVTQLIGESEKLQFEKERLEVKEESIKDVIKSLEELLDNLRHLWVDTNNEIFDGSLNCPTCGRPYEEHKQEEIKDNFNLDKSKKLTEIQKKAETTKTEIEEKKSELVQIESTKKELNSRILELKEEIKNKGEFTEELKLPDKPELPAEYLKLNEEIKQLEEEISNITVKDNSSLLKEKKVLSDDLSSLIGKLALKDENSKLEARIEEYMDKEKDLASKYEEQQEILFLCDEYLRVFIELVSEKINNLFDYVSFKLFDTQVNGGLVETCEVTVDGVPYSDINNAAKINSGLDVINTLSKHLGIRVPIFVDNAESVNKLVKTESQLVKLIVSEDKELNIKGE